MSLFSCAHTLLPLIIPNTDNAIPTAQLTCPMFTLLLFHFSTLLLFHFFLSLLCSSASFTSSTSLSSYFLTCFPLPSSPSSPSSPTPSPHPTLPTPQHSHPTTPALPPSTLPAPPPANKTTHHPSAASIASLPTSPLVFR